MQAVFIHSPLYFPPKESIKKDQKKMDLSPCILKKKNNLPFPSGGGYKSIQGIYGFNKIDFFFLSQVCFTRLAWRSQLVLIFPHF